MNTSQPLTVTYSMSGKAIFGTDYTVSGTFGQITVPGGASSATVTLTALTNNLMKKKAIATMTLQPGEGYKLTKNKKAKVTIVK